MQSITSALLQRAQLAEFHPDDAKRRRAGFRKVAFLRLPVKEEERLNSAQANWFDNAAEGEKDASCTETQVKLSDLHTVQFGVSKKKVASLKPPFTEKIWVDKLGDLLVIADGNHRLEHLLEAGETSATVWVRDLTAWDRPGYT